MSNLVRCLTCLAILVPFPAIAAQYRCDNNPDAKENLEDFRWRAEERDRDLLQEGSQAYPLNAVLGFNFEAKAGVTYEAFVTTGKNTHLTLEIVDERARRVKYQEVVWDESIQFAFQVTKPGTYTIKIGAYGSEPLRCFYWGISKPNSRS